LPLPHRSEQRAAVLDELTAQAPAPTRLNVLVTQAAARYADRVAVRSQTAALTYRELLVSAQRLAAGLRAWGIRPGDIVAVLAERSPGLVVAIVAVLEAGATLLPLEQEDPPGRVALELDDAKPVLILAAASLAGSLPSTSRVVLLDDLESALPAPDA